MYIRLAQVLWGLFMMVLPSIIGRVLLALGMGFVTFKGFDFIVTWILNNAKDNLAGMPSEILQFLGFLWVDKAIGMIFSAFSAALLVKLAGSTSVTKMVNKAPG